MAFCSSLSVATEACPGDGPLYQFTEGLLSAGERGEVEAHLDRCATCRALVGAAMEEATPLQRREHALTFSERGATEPAITKGTVVDRYVVLREVGRGGMGRVFAAYDPKLDRTIALKALRDARPNSEALARLLREAQALARLSHPNVVNVHDAVESKVGLFVAMEFVEGQTLTQWQNLEKRGWPELLPVYRQAARGLAAAHAAGVVHRDFKPDNVMVQVSSGSLRVRVMDFGLAQCGPAAVAESELYGTLPEQAQTLTATGDLVGTPAYMAPEQFRQQDVTAASDQFSFCVALYEALEGERPFTGRSLKHLASNVAAGRLRAPVGDYPAWLKRLLRRGLSAAARDRYATMDALVDAIAVGRSRRRRLGLVAGTTVAGAAVAAGLFHDDDAAQRACRDDARAIVGRWEAKWEAPVRATFRDRIGPDADALVAKVGSQIDVFAEDWRRTYDAVCTAAYSEKRLAEVDRVAAVTCLENQREFLATVLESAETATSEAAWGIVSAVSTLPTPSTCEQADAEPRVAGDNLAEARRRLARARGHEAVGAPDQVISEAHAGLAALEGLDAAGTRAHLLWLFARAKNQLGDAKAARAARADALREASRAGDGPFLAKLWLFHVRSILDSDRDAVGATTLLEAAEVAVAAVPDDPALQSLLHSTRGAIALDAGRYEDAQRDFSAALADAERGRPTVEALYARRSELALAESKLGNREAGLAMQRSSLATLVEAFGERHPLALLGLDNIAVTCRRINDTECARDVLLRSLALRAATDLGRWKPLLMLGQIEYDAGNMDEAERLARESLALWVEQGGEDAPGSTGARLLLVNVHRTRGQYEEALAQAQSIRRIKDAATGPEHAGRALGFAAVGQALFDLQRHAEAEDAFRNALAIRERILDEGDILVGYAQVNLAKVCLETGKRAEARGLAERAAGVLDAAEASSVWRAEARFLLARALDAADRERADALAREALALYESAGPGNAAERKAVRAWIER